MNRPGEVSRWRLYKIRSILAEQNYAMNIHNINSLARQLRLMYVLMVDECKIVNGNKLRALFITSESAATALDVTSTLKCKHIDSDYRIVASK